MTQCDVTDQFDDSASHDPEAALIERLRGDPAAFGEVFDAHYESVARYVLRRTGDEHMAEDIVSEVFVKAMQSIKRFRSRGVPLRAWLLRIASNAVNHRLRRQRVRKKVFAELQARHDGRVSESHEEEAKATAGLLMRTLPMHYQEALCLHIGCGYSMDEMALILHCRVGTVKSRLSRARQALKGAAIRIGFKEDHDE